MSHRHKSVEYEDTAWHYCVAGRDCNGAAHGNIVRVQHCTCGAQRMIEINFNHIGKGRWTEGAGLRADPRKVTP